MQERRHDSVKSLEATPNPMIGGAAVGNIPTESSYPRSRRTLANVTIMRVLLSAGGAGDHRISFDPTSL